MDSVEFTLQLLSTIFTIVGIIVAIGAMDTRWSLAAVISRQLRTGRYIDWEAERRRWEEAYRIDIVNTSPFHKTSQLHAAQIPSDIPLRSWSGLSNSTIVAETNMDRDDKKIIRKPAEDITRPQQADPDTSSKRQRKDSASKTVVIGPPYESRQQPPLQQHYVPRAAKTTRTQQAIHPVMRKTRARPVPKGMEPTYIDERSSETA